MDKNAIKKYAVWARRELISRVSQKALQYGITDKDIVPATATSVNGVVLSAEEMKQRKALIEQINAKCYEQVMEEVAYTWFNRFSALRFMEVNGYLPSHVRVFTDEDNNFKPQILAEAINLEMDGLDMDKVYALKDANDDDTLFKYLIIVQCNALNPLLPGMFQRISDYTELLFPDNLLRDGSAIQQMIELIPEEDWKDAVQIIGWLYQFYNIEPKADVFAKNGKISKEEIPAATQLFTPDWIVRYMVENSLGRLWVEGHPNDDLKSEWKYYLEEAEQEPDVQVQLDAVRKEYRNLNPEDIKFIDPCMGSGHILVYAFDVLMQIYESCGYAQRDAVRSILENNLYGLDIDERAAQLAYFAVMMKARQYDRRILSRYIEPHIHVIQESNALHTIIPEGVRFDKAHLETVKYLVNIFRDAKEYGSILNIEQRDYAGLQFYLEKLLEATNDALLPHDMMFLAWAKTDLPILFSLVEQAKIMAQKYDVVVTNPPYMSVSAGGAKLNQYVKDNYPDSKADMFAVFIEQCRAMLKPNGYQAMLTMHSWMFLSSYERLREKLSDVDTINMAHLGARAFEEIGGEVVQTTSFVFRKSNVYKYKSTFCRLTDPTSQSAKEDLFLAGTAKYITSNDSFRKLPGAPVAYWVSNNITEAFSNGNIYDISVSPSQNITGNNDRFLRKHWEIDRNDFGLDSWIFYAKGGEYRRWWGNLTELVNWTPAARHIYHHGDGKHASQIINRDYWYKRGITWGLIAQTSFRVLPDNATFDKQGSSIFLTNNEDYNIIIGFLNTKVALTMLNVLNTTLALQVRDVRNLPYDAKRIKPVRDIINRTVENNIEISKEDWDSFETSWDFVEHPLVRFSHDLWDATAVGASIHYYYGGHPKVSCPLELCYMLWQGECNERFKKLKANEEELNRIFIDIYGLQDELTPEVNDDDVTVRKADLKRDIKSLISYAVGCMFGRYSLNMPGLAYAGGEWDDAKYTTFKADKDSIIPICDDEYFADDIVGRFIRFIEVVYGKDSLNDNLKFIADALGGSGQPKDVIRKYFMDEFYADHLKTYQKRPIYWLFDSGKKGGFRALVYMHRYQPDTIARMRTDYVHEQQSRYRTAIADLEQRIASVSTSERVKLNKRLKTLQEQTTEIQSYEEKIHHLADQYICIDLDDGVKVNYEKFKDVLAKIK